MIIRTGPQSIPIRRSAKHAASPFPWGPPSSTAAEGSLITVPAAAPEAARKRMKVPAASRGILMV
ncbi:MAG: hypothetical protein ACMUHM_08090 [Thermoplasmatota archaeon]